MQKKLSRLLIVLAVLLALLAALWYARPVDVYTLGDLGEIEHISISPKVFDEQEDLHELGVLNLDASDPRFAPILERVEALRFQRSPADLVTRHFRETRITGSSLQLTGYFFLLTLSDGESVMQLQFFVDSWDYFTPRFSRNLPVGMEDAAEVGSDLGAFLWEMAQSGESSS